MNYCCHQLHSNDRRKIRGVWQFSQHLSQSHNFTTILPINEIVTYYFLVFCSFVESFSFLHSSVFLLPHRCHLKCQSWPFYSCRPYATWFNICCAIETFLSCQVNPRSFPFHRLSVEANTPGSRLEKGVCLSRSICSESWEKNWDRYCPCPEYFSE